MHKATPPRKIKARLHLLIVLISIFFATLLVCGVIFTAFLFSGFTILSPITKSQSASTDAQIAEIQTFCQQNHIDCESVQTIDETSIQITLGNHSIILLSTKKDLKNQLSSLQEATAQLTIKGKQFKKLDFRFANIVITF